MPKLAMHLIGNLIDVSQVSDTGPSLLSCLFTISAVLFGSPGIHRRLTALFFESLSLIHHSLIRDMFVCCVDSLCSETFMRLKYSVDFRYLEVEGSL